MQAFFLSGHFSTEWKLVPYTTEEHITQAWKFIGWSKRGLLIVGNQICHQHDYILEVVCMLDESLAEDLPDCVGVIHNEDSPKIYSWVSPTLGVETPEAFRLQVEELLLGKKVE